MFLTNRYDCGMFMIKYADFYSRGLGLCFNQVKHINTPLFTMLAPEMKETAKRKVMLCLDWYSQFPLDIWRYLKSMVLQLFEVICTSWFECSLSSINLYITSGDYKSFCLQLLDRLQFLDTTELFRKASTYQILEAETKKAQFLRN